MAAIPVVLMLCGSCGGPESTDPQPPPPPATNPPPAESPEPNPVADPGPASEGAEPGSQNAQVQSCTTDCIESRQTEAKAADVIATECASQCEQQCIEACVQARQAQAASAESIEEGCTSDCQ